MSKYRLLIKSVEIFDNLYLLNGQIEPNMQFKPGQYLWFYKNINGNIIKRAYSFANIPDEDPRFVIKPVGIMSKYLMNAVGDVIDVEGPLGHISIDKLISKKSVVLIGNGPGLGPLRSIFIYLAKNNYSGSLKFNYITNSKNFPFYNELTQYKNFIVSSSPSYESLMKNLESNTIFVVIGPTPFVMSVRKTLIENYNISKQNILIEPHGFI